MGIFTVANIEEGVELANKFKTEGRYNWFRGQVQEWPPVSSLNRFDTSGDSERMSKAVRRIQMFSDWVKKIPELQYLGKPEHVNDLFAIMQHYGIPTYYIDFTTDPGVAGFFAADTKAPPSEGRSCIYCLDTNDLMSLWDILRNLDERKGASMELVEIDVRNLWRLQAQKGVFLFCPYNWQIDYPMDRIVFPYSGYPSYPTRERIYPEDKSPLEQLLDQYFSLENSTFFNEEFRQFIENIKKRGGNAGYTTWDAFPKGFYEQAFTEGGVTPLDSWCPAALKPWDFESNEDYHDSIGPTLSLKLDPHGSAEDVRRSMSFGLKQILRSESAIRSKTANWLFTELPESLSQDELGDVLRPIWNGMRRLPYSDEEIADAFGSAVALLMVGLQRELAPDCQEQRFSECFGACIRVEFASLDGSSSRGLASLESLRRTLRTDIAELLAPKYIEYANDCQNLFTIIYNPRLMFEFEDFKKTFALQVIPSQAVEKRALILFNPAQLTTFGRP